MYVSMWYSMQSIMLGVSNNTCVQTSDTITRSIIIIVIAYYYYPVFLHCVDAFLLCSLLLVKFLKCRQGILRQYRNVIIALLFGSHL